MGCIGTCRYVALNHDRFWGGILRTLAQFAFYAGVGTRTTMGFGQTVVWDDGERL